MNLVVRSCHVSFVSSLWLSYFLTCLLVCFSEFGHFQLLCWFPLLPLLSCDLVIGGTPSSFFLRSLPLSYLLVSPSFFCRSWYVISLGFFLFLNSSRSSVVGVCDVSPISSTLDFLPVITRTTTTTTQLRVELRSWRSPVERVGD